TPLHRNGAGWHSQAQLRELPSSWARCSMIRQKVVFHRYETVFNGERPLNYCLTIRQGVTTETRAPIAFRPAACGPYLAFRATTWEDEDAAICFFETDNWPPAHVIGGRAEGTTPHREALPGKIGTLLSAAIPQIRQPPRNRGPDTPCAASFLGGQRSAAA